MKNFLRLIALPLIFVSYGCGTDSSPDDPVEEPPQVDPIAISVPEGFTVEEFADGINLPTNIAFAPDGSNRLFVNELQTGNILIFENGERLSQPFASVNTMVTGGFPVDGENGLIGIAFDPDYPAEPYVYVSFAVRTDSGIEGFVARFRDNNNRGEDFTILLDGLPGANGHQVESIAFGPDKKLYVSVGDAFDAGNVQDINEFHGKMLRMNRDGTIPTDNPFENSYVWALGLRNSYGVAFRQNGDLIANENGPGEKDELNVITKGGNYGWPTNLGMTGDTDFMDPVHVWNDIVAPTGLHLYTGSQFPERYRGAMFQVLFGRTFSDGPDSRSKRIQVINFNGSGLETTVTFEDFAIYEFTGKGNPIDITHGPDGSLYLSDIFQGKIYKIRFGE